MLQRSPLRAIFLAKQLYSSTTQGRSNIKVEKQVQEFCPCLFFNAILFTTLTLTLLTVLILYIYYVHTCKILSSYTTYTYTTFTCTILKYGTETT